MRYVIFVLTVALAIGACFSAEAESIVHVTDARTKSVLICDLTPFATETAKDLENLAQQLCPEATETIFTIPFSVCDDSTDCNRAITQACRARGSNVRSMQFDRDKKDCRGDCDDGTTVWTVCPRP